MLTIWHEFKTVVLPLLVALALLGAGYYAHRQVVHALEADKAALLGELRALREVVAANTEAINHRGVLPLDTRLSQR